MLGGESRRGRRPNATRRVGAGGKWEFSHPSTNLIRVVGFQQVGCSKKVAKLVPTPSLYLVYTCIFSSGREFPMSGINRVILFYSMLFYSTCAGKLGIFIIFGGLVASVLPPWIPEELVHLGGERAPTFGSESPCRSRSGSPRRCGGRTGRRCAHQTWRCWGDTVPR